MTGIGFFVFVAFACLMLQTQVAPQEYHTPRFITVADCDDVCTKFPTAVCKVDCLSINAEGAGTDCVNQFYGTDGKIVYCYE
ncbi:hypothetical protein Btru_012134 [Bulinus truncatus]|nr:hypothetical protein Btru_012134 [Bulinus truncatus]